jgi:hypothetical protein
MILSTKGSSIPNESALPKVALILTILYLKFNKSTQEKVSILICSKIIYSKILNKKLTNLTPKIFKVLFVESQKVRRARLMMKSYKNKNLFL